MKYKKPKSRRRLFRAKEKYNYASEFEIQNIIDFFNQPLLIRFRMTRSWFYEKRINWNKTRKNIMKPL